MTRKVSKLFMRISDVTILIYALLGVIQLGYSANYYPKLFKLYLILNLLVIEVLFYCFTVIFGWVIVCLIKDLLTKKNL